MRSRGIFSDRRMINNRVTRKVPQPLKERWHVQVGKVGEIELRLIISESRPRNGLEFPVIRSYAAHYYDMLGGWLQIESSDQGLFRLHHAPGASEMGIRL